MTPGAWTLILQVGAGAAVYAAMVVVFNIAGLRRIVIGWLRPLIARA